MIITLNKTKKITFKSSYNSLERYYSRSIIKKKLNKKNATNAAYANASLIETVLPSPARAEYSSIEKGLKESTKTNHLLINRLKRPIFKKFLTIIEVMNVK